MKKNAPYFSLVFLASLIVLSACQNKDKDPQPPTRAELLAGNFNKKWKNTAATLVLKNTSSPIIYTADLFNPADSLMTKPFLSCQKDNILVFFSDKKYLLDEGTIKCNASNPQTSEATWDFNSDKTILTISVVDPISKKVLTTESTIKEISTTTLKLENITFDTYTYNGRIDTIKTTINYTLVAQ
ncbi:MAG: hypothetical protein V4714_20030 [Bacteroidota bacterium]